MLLVEVLKFTVHRTSLLFYSVPFTVRHVFTLFPFSLSKTLTLEDPHSLAITTIS